MDKAADTLGNHAYRKLESLIVTLRLRPGTVVTERQMIELSDQPRTPVRIAIHKLEWQGLMRITAGGRLRITDIDESNLADVIQVRRQLEPIAAALAADHAKPEHKEALKDCVLAMQAAAAAEDRLGFLAADKLFDDIVEAACPNRFLTISLAPMQSHSRRHWFARAPADAMEKTAATHVAVMSAIQNGDAIAASAATSRLLDHVGQF